MIATKRKLVLKSMSKFENKNTHFSFIFIYVMDINKNLIFITIIDYINRK